jgi:hypothetical protein
MDINAKRKLVAGGVAALALIGGGAAIAANKLSPKEESQAIVDDAAKQLGIPSAKLSDALKQALKNRVDAAVADGSITKAQADAIKARIDAGEVPLLGFGGRDHDGPGGPHGHGGPGGPHLADAATYLGLTAAELETRLESGKTLAQIATAQGKTTAGLVDALYASEKKELDAAVAAGRLTQAQEDAMLSGLKARLTDRVNGTFTPRDHDGDFRGFRGPPPAAGAPAVF